MYYRKLLFFRDESIMLVDMALPAGECIIIYSKCYFQGDKLEACNDVSEMQ